jgi:dsDNA-specific endonuclease/ATPase MutS2
MSIRVGDTVQVLDEDAEGVVSAVQGKSVMVEIDGFEFPYSIHQLMLIHGNNEVHHVIPEVSETHTTEREVKVSSPISLDVMRSVNKYGQPELDLHIEELVTAPQHLSAHKKLQIQIHALEQFIHQCHDRSISKFVVIHGVGQGVLKTEVRKVLQSHGHIKVQDAAYNLYGSGATLAHIQGLFS